MNWTRKWNIEPHRFQNYYTRGPRKVYFYWYFSQSIKTEEINYKYFKCHCITDCHSLFCSMGFISGTKCHVWSINSPFQLFISSEITCLNITRKCRLRTYCLTCLKSHRSSIKFILVLSSAMFLWCSRIRLFTGRKNIRRSNRGIPNDLRVNSSSAESVDSWEAYFSSMSLSKFTGNPVHRAEEMEVTFGMNLRTGDQNSWGNSGTLWVINSSKWIVHQCLHNQLER